MAERLVRSKSWALAVSALLCFGALSPDVRASCAAPTVVISKPKPRLDEVARLAPGSRATARGFAWLKGCDDTGGGAVGGCGGDNESDVEEPYKDIEVRIAGPVTEKLRKNYSRKEFVGDTRFSEVVGTAAADRQGRFTLSFRVPDLPPGPYYLMGSEPGGPTLVQITKP